MPQSRSRNLTTPSPTPRASQKSMAASTACLAGHPPVAGDRPQVVDRLGLRRHEGDRPRRRASRVARHEDVDHRQPVLAREVEVALVVRRAAEDRAGAVVHQDEVGDPDRQLHAGSSGCTHPQAGVDAALLGGLDLLLAGAELRGLGDEGGDLRVRLPAPWPADGRARRRRSSRPSSVSGRVVKTSSVSKPSGAPRVSKRNCSPRLLPIQLRCIVRTFSGQCVQPVDRGRAARRPCRRS